MSLVDKVFYFEDVLTLGIRIIPVVPELSVVSVL